MCTCPWCLAPLKEVAYSHALVDQCTRCTFHEVIEVVEPLGSAVLLMARGCFIPRALIFLASWLCGC